MTTIRELGGEQYDAVTNYTRPRYGSAEAEEAAKERNRERRKKQTVIAAVAEGCTVETVRGTTLRDGEEVRPEDVGGMAKLERLRGVGAVNMITENERKTRAGEYELTATKAFTHGGRVYDVGEGFNADELDVPGTDVHRAVGADGRIVERPGRAPVVGSEYAEHLIERQLAERARLRAKVTAAVRRRLAEAKQAEAGE